MAATVTIDRSYFETLLRRAEFHTSGRDLSTPLDLPVVTIPKVDHDNLLQAAKEYGLLKEALYRGGIAEETLAILIQGGDSSHLPPGPQDDAFSELSYSISKRQQRPSTFSTQSSNLAIPSTAQGSLRPWANGYNRQGSFRQTSSGHDDISYFTPDGGTAEPGRMSTPTLERPQYAKQEQRSIALKNLSEKVRHKDIANVIRGGAVLDIYLRANDRSATVSFVDGIAAQAFLTHVKRNDIYLHGKRVEISWNDRQFFLPPHVASKISNGATRNLVIRNAHADITEQRIRDDLEHIHNLMVVNLTFTNSDVLVSLNSVHNSLFARTCLMSRGKYKGLRIDFCADECAQSLPVTQRSPLRTDLKPVQKKTSSMVNRFQMLNMDGTEEESDSSTESDDLTKFTPAWAAQAVAV